MKDLLITALEQICPNNVYLQGTLAADVPYPENFITIWTNYTSDNSHYDDEVVSYDWDFTVIYYTTNPATISTKSTAIRTALKALGFIPQGKGNDIPSDRPSHTGWVMEYKYKEYINEL